MTSERIRPSSVAALAAIGLLLAPTLVGAQTVRGVVVDEETDAPVAGAFVLLLAQGTPDAPAPSDSALDGAVTDSLGRFAVRAPAPGRYPLRVDRIGFRSHLAAPAELGAGETIEREIRIAFEPIDLLSLESPGRRCVVDPRGESTLGRVWEEARKALSSTIWAERRAAFRFTIRTYEKKLDPRSEEVLDEASRERSGVRTSSPYVSLPAEELAAHGYARVEQDAIRYHAPDAQALTSDSFLKNHCFRLTWGDRVGQPGWIGLAFEPARGGPDIVDVEGVVWLDVSTAELKRVDLTYVDLPEPLQEGSAQAQVEFGRAPTGAWIIPRWWIRTPVLGLINDPRGGGLGPPRMTSTGRQVGVVARLETGGEVVRIESVGS